jgi:hypothetical protein
MATSLTHLYGLSLELPSDWIDWTAYKFRSEGAALRSITFALEPIPAQHAQTFLMERGRAISSAFDSARVGPLHRYPNPQFNAVGFEAELSPAEPKQYIALVLLPEDNRSLVVTAKAVTGYAGAFKHIVGSLQRGTGKGPHLATGQSYRVYDYLFTSSISLRTPTQFAFATPDESARLSSEWSMSLPDFAGPQWSEAFVFPPDAAVRETNRQEGRVFGATGTTSAGQLLPPPELEHIAVSAVAATPELAVDLFWAEARTTLDGSRYFYVRFQSQRGAAVASATWRDIVGSVRWEG